MYKIQAAWIGFTVAAMLSFSASAQDASMYVVAKGQNFFQTGAATLISDTNAPAQFHSDVSLASPGSIFGVTLTRPNGTNDIMEDKGDNFKVDLGLSSKAAL